MATNGIVQNNMVKKSLCSQVFGSKKGSIYWLQNYVEWEAPSLLRIAWRSLCQGRILTVARCSIMSYDDHMADKTNYQDRKTM